MNSPNLLFLLLLLTFASTINAATPVPNCGSTGNFTAGSTYQTTLTTLVSSISTTNSSSLSYAFFNASRPISGSSQILYLFGLCRGDLTAQRCHACLDDLASQMSSLCPLQKEAVFYIANCIIRYSDASFFGTVTTKPALIRATGPGGSRPNANKAALTKLLNGLGAEAAGGGSLRKYASGNESVGPDVAYAFVQCTPDLTEQQCSNCLVMGVQTLMDCCATNDGGRFMVPSCWITWKKNNKFFETVSQPLPPPPPSTPTPQSHGANVPPPPPPGGKNNSTKTVIIAVATSASAVLVVGIIILQIVKRKKKNQPRQGTDGEVVDEISTAESLQFDFATIREATDNFSDSRKLGQGGFGPVYVGRLSNGKEIAVKRLSQNASQGEIEFKNEVMLLARLQHRNLVRLRGFCVEGVERILIYQFMANSSLDQFIFNHVKRAKLNWGRRHEIIMGVARGLLYLHEDSPLRIIHRDLKASNILLDSVMNPKISDFGMARLFTLDQTQAKTNRIVGTYGYMAPEYVMHGNFSFKSDVYSFGVLVLEIVSGRRNSLFEVGDKTELFLSYIWKSWREGTMSNIIDPCMTSGMSDEIARCVHIGLLCVQENVANRPTMASVLLMLNSPSVTLNVPSQPGFFMHSSIEPDMSFPQDNRSRRSNQFSKNEASMTEPYPR